MDLELRYCLKCKMNTLQDKEKWHPYYNHGRGWIEGSTKKEREEAVKAWRNDYKNFIKEHMFDVFYCTRCGKRFYKTDTEEKDRGYLHKNTVEREFDGREYYRI